MTVAEIRGLSESGNHDKMCKQLFERIYQTKFPEEPTECFFELRVRFEGSTMRLTGELRTTHEDT